MSGHSKWSQIKHRKGVADQKRGQLFSKLLNAVAVAARAEPNPEFNPRLRSAVEKAKENKVPLENIERAIRRASDPSLELEELTLEAYGPGGAALLIEAVSDSRNRTIAEIRKILSDNHGKWAESGSVRWAFEEAPGVHREWRAKFPQPLSPEDKTLLEQLEAALESHSDVQNVFTSAAARS